MKKKTIHIADTEIDIMPCPFCGSTNLSFTYRMSYGHGDRGYENGRIECGDCSGAKGNVHGYGEPSIYDQMFIWGLWNDRPLKQK